MELKVKGRIRVTLNSDDITEAIQTYTHFDSIPDRVLNYAKDKVAHLERNVRYVNHRFAMPDKAVITFRAGETDETAANNRR